MQAESILSTELEAAAVQALLEAGAALSKPRKNPDADGSDYRFVHARDITPAPDYGEAIRRELQDDTFDSAGIIHGAQGGSISFKTELRGPGTPAADGVTAPVALARQQLVSLFADFLKDFPEVRIELDMSDRLSPLATEGFDLAIRHTARPPDTHVAWALCDTQSVLVATPSYLRRRGEPLTPADLQAHNCLHYPRSQESPAWTFEPRQPSGEAERITLPVSGNFAANNSEALREAETGALQALELPARLREVTAGAVRVDGVDVRDLDLVDVYAERPDRLDPVLAQNVAAILAIGQQRSGRVLQRLPRKTRKVRVAGAGAGWPCLQWRRSCSRCAAPWHRSSRCTSTTTTPSTRPRPCPSRDRRAAPGPVARAAWTRSRAGSASPPPTPSTASSAGTRRRTPSPPAGPCWTSTLP